MLRMRAPVRPLTRADRDEALALCARDPATNVFAAARILEGGLGAGTPLGYHRDGELSALCWVSANLVPVEADAEALSAFADRIRRQRAACASILGPSDQVAGLWAHLQSGWAPERNYRLRQPVLGTSTPPSALGIDLDRRVRPATARETDLVLPAAEHMFTAEIGYRPYSGNPRGYRRSLQRLIDAGRTYVIVDRGQVVFKADVGSVALGCSQVQGVWLAPQWRGQGIAAGAMAAVIEQVMLDHHTPLVTLYVNDYNFPAIATYRRVGMVPMGEFSTILL